ncbi:hypothetical protein KO361_06215 [Candidatus Woesearchaeota archaeon]|nr:hypothetical protein [Candidatus Woesearchaeota archaeon]
MVRGRPIGSKVRQNMIEILYFLGSAHGYHIYKVYKNVYAPVTLRAIYYHLKKGLETDEFEIAEIQKEHGDFSWGTEAEKTYYKLGKRAKPKIDNQLKLFLDSKPEFKQR